MLSASDFARTRTVTWRPHLAMCSGVCPAELSPPTTNTFRPRMAAERILDRSHRRDSLYKGDVGVAPTGRRTHRTRVRRTPPVRPCRLAAVCCLTTSFGVRRPRADGDVCHERSYPHVDDDLCSMARCGSHDVSQSTVLQALCRRN
jgi:hypothetical protein